MNIFDRAGYEESKDTFFVEAEIILADGGRHNRGIQVRALSKTHAEACAEMHIHNKRDVIGDIKHVNIVRVRQKPCDPEYKIFNFIKGMMY